MRVAERVAEVERLAQAVLTLVGAHHLGLDLDAPRDGVERRRRLRVEQCRELGVEPREVVGVGEHAVLDRFGESGTSLRRRAACGSSRRPRARRRVRWKAPTRFLPAAVSTPVLPPIEASIIASSDVGHCTTGTPRMKVAATNPARSPTTPPPSATTVVSRPQPASSSPSVTRAQVSRVLCASPDGMTCTDTGPCAASESDERLGVVRRDLDVADDRVVVRRRRVGDVPRVLVTEAGRDDRRDTSPRRSRAPSRLAGVASALVVTTSPRRRRRGGWRGARA